MFLVYFFESFASVSSVTWLLNYSSAVVIGGYKFL